MTLLRPTRRTQALSGALLAGALTQAACGSGDEGGGDGSGGDGDVVTIDFLQPLPKSMAFYPLFVGEQLGYEIARYGFGPAAERRRRAAEDPQIRRTVELVRGSSSTRTLLGLADPVAPRAH